VQRYLHWVAQAQLLEQEQLEQLQQEQEQEQPQLHLHSWAFPLQPGLGLELA